MSGNSSRRRRQTAPIVSGRSLASARTPWPSRSALEEGQLVLPDLHLVPVLELLFDAAAVDEGAVEAALVLDRRSRPGDARGSAWRRETVTSSRKMSESGERPIVSRSPLERERLPRPPAAGADDDRRPLGPQLRERRRDVLARSRPTANDIVASPRSSRDQQRAALLAVPRGLEVLEAAFRAVDVRQAVPCQASELLFAEPRRSLDGEDLGEACEIDLARAGSRPSPPAAAAATTSSARRMSILPCSSRRRYEMSCSSFRSARIRSRSSASDSVFRSGRASTRHSRSDGRELSPSSEADRGDPSTST